METVRGEDWYGRDLAGLTWQDTSFVDVDLTEVRSESAVWNRCTFERVRFNVSEHADSAFANCVFRDCSFFDATFTRCKLVGSRFEGCEFSLLTIEGGNWSFVDLGKAQLESVTVNGAKFREADFTGAHCVGASFIECDLSAADLTGADFTSARLVGSDMNGADLADVRMRGTIIDERQAAQLAEAQGLIVVPATT